MTARTGSTARAALAAVLFAAAVCLGGGTAAAAEKNAQNIDLVVLVDTSESMFPYFDDLMTYLVQDLLTKRLHRGDTFHLLSFSSAPEEEISVSVNSDEAAHQAFGRVLLLHALGKYTDLVSAMQFLYQYVKELPETNPKHVIIITDGVHDPPPGSPNKTDEATVKGLVVSSAQTMRREGWEVTILKVPPEPAPADQGMKSYLADIAAAVGVPVIPYPKQDKTTVTGVTTGYPTLLFPAALGQVGKTFAALFRVKNWKAEPIMLSLSSVQSEGSELLERKVVVTVPANGDVPFTVPLRLPMSYPKGAHDAAVRLVFDDDPRISPIEGTISFTYTGQGGLPLPRLTFLYVVYILLGLAAIFLLVLLFRYLRKKLGEAPLAGIARVHGASGYGALGYSTAGGAAGRDGGDDGDRRGRGRGTGAAAQQSGERTIGKGPASRTPAPAARVSLMTAGTRGAPRRGPHLPLMSSHPAPWAGTRPTVTSIRNAMPRPDWKASLPPLIEMRVELQNHRVGFRNVHRIAPGGTKTIGGRFSSFLVFLVPVPSRIAEIRNVDGHYVFTPLKPDLFPGLKGPLKDCLGKGIPFVSSKGKEQLLYFLKWVSPLEEINRVLKQAGS
jgi:Mg-chelatase subunit ChlD